DKEILVYCQVGMRGYVACRLLEQNGFRCRNLSGGYRTYMMATGSEDAPVKGAGEMKDDTGAGVRAPEPAEPAKTVKLVDACGLQCPGPIMRVAAELQPLGAGEAIDIVATDPAFTQDIAAWCQSTGNTLRAVTPENGRYRATVVKGGGAATATALPAGKKKTMVVFSGDFDRAMAAFIIANGAAAMGSEVTMFFTFWGLNILRKPQPVAVRKNLVERMFGAMMPRGAERLALSRMNMAGMGLAMIKGIMRKKKVSSLPELIESARRAGVRLVACAMSMELMGIKQEELIDGVEEGGVAAYLGAAEGGNVNLFI
ncbi:MAG TPA: DsrE/DsrF/DrsH-like family protein, partial [Armatimonadota bacterium]|nr:DsrE/DsrF/DrsH-like family protein [Armatimonadota bacterium]